MAEISRVRVTEILGRYCVNQHGVEFQITDLWYCLDDDNVLFYLSPLDRESGEVIPDSEVGVTSLKGFRII